MQTPPQLSEIRSRAEAGDARAQYMLAAALSSNGDRVQAETWLTRAAESGEPDALYTLATRRIQSGQRAEECARLVADAAEKGSVPAQKLQAAMRAEGFGVAEDWPAAVDAVMSLARQGDAGAQREIAGLLLMIDPDDVNAAALIRAAASRDAVASAVCVRRFAQGRAFADRDSAARALERLEAAKYPRAGALSKAIASVSGEGETPPPVDWDAAAARLAAPPPENAPGMEVLSESPSISLAKDAAPTEMLDYVIAHAAARMAPSTTVDSRNNSVRRDAYRTSLSATLGPVDLDLALIALNRRIADVAGHDYRCAEFLSVLSYSPGQQYRPHFDWIAPGEKFGGAGQRVKTALLYLNDDYDGGETHFLAPDIHVKGAAGDLLVFSNVLEDGEIDTRTRHAGLPVTGGTKWLGSKWLREKRADF